MKSALEIALEIGLLSGLNMAAVYVAAFVYGLNWTGILTVMVLASVFTAGMTHLILSKAVIHPVISQASRAAIVSDAIGVLLVSLTTSLLILIMLSYRFNLPMALGVSLLAGILSTLIRRLLALA